LYSLIYASSAVKPFTQSQLLNLVTESRERNERLGITGLLLYKDGKFMQALEGEEGMVRSLFGEISADRRHGGVRELLECSISRRQFPYWPMGFKDLKSREVLRMPGYNEFLDDPLTGSEFSADPSRCQKLLLVFK
jgi:Sensors of blue-light using FAD